MATRTLALTSICALAFALGAGCGETQDAGGEKTTAASQKPAKAPETAAQPAPASRPGNRAPAAPAAKGQSPEKYTVVLETTAGEIVIDVTRAWAPRGADRFFELVTGGYYTDVAFFRVVKGFMAQAGIHGDPAMNQIWRGKRIQDDPLVGQSNLQGMVTFAMGGPNSRTTQFFINLVDNARLDPMGFPPFGKVRDIAPVQALYDGYGEGAPRGRGPSQMRIQTEGNAYLKKDFPELDYIKSARILEQ